ncbi:1160_t:CDS:2 [Paraglomus occultum]|uniref:1160_t:CDS:1 n=1 Tax=Paraglomus occultum TaxID=144539 RepID=A0A9N9CAZ2_9GLOM|nr:1160_t:CDS:2 [Paraglomus occultum]
MGNLYQFPGDFGKWVNKLQETYGDMFELYIGRERNIWLNRGDIVEKMMINSPRNIYLLRMNPNDGLDEMDLTTKGLAFNRNLKNWKLYQSVLNKSLVAPEFQKETLNLLQKAFKEMEGYWEKLGPNAIIDVPQWNLNLIGDVIIKLTTGRSPYSLTTYFNEVYKGEKAPYPKSTPWEETAKILKCLETYFTAVQYFLFMPSIFRHSLFYPMTKSLLKSINWKQEKLKEIIKDRRQEIAITDVSEPLRADILTMFITANTSRSIIGKTTKDDEARPLTDGEIEAILWETIGGSIDVTAHVLGYIVEYMSRHPEAKAKMITEIDSVFNGNTERAITLEDLEKLNYCEAIINETLRLIPTGPLSFRINAEEDVIGGHIWKEGTQFALNYHGMTTNKSDWTDAKKFQPERFLSSAAVKKIAFLPFGAGARACPGKKIAYDILKTEMALLYRKYEVDSIDPTAEIKYHYNVVNACDSGKVYVRERNG